MIVGVIVAILAAVALPSYKDYVTRGQLQDGTTTLADGAVKMEQCYQDASPHSYAACACPLATQYFTYACSTMTATTFKITATGKGNLNTFSYTIDQTAARTSTTPWAAGTPACWILRRGDT